MTKYPPVLSFLRLQIGVFLPSRDQVGLKSVRVPSVSSWNPVPSALMMKIAVFHFSVTGSSLSRRKQTSISPVKDHDGLKSQWPVVTGLPSGLPTSVTWISPLQK